MSHVPILAHGKAREVLIIGGGDCGIAEEVLKHKSVERLTQVEIDASVVEFAKEHFPEFTRPVFADKRFESVIDDGMKYVAKTDRRFDVIIVDFDRPAGAGRGAFQPEILRRLPALHAQGRRSWSRRTACRSCSAASSPPASAKFRRLFADGYLLRGGDPDLCGRATWRWAGPRDNTKLRQASVKTIAEPLQEGRQLPDQYWTPGGARRGLRAAALHRRPGE